MKFDVGYIAGFYDKKRAKVTVDIELRHEEGKKVLAISGSIWNSKLTDCLECGQCDDTLSKGLANGDLTLVEMEYATFRRILDIWEKWHLNNMRAECEHQEAFMPGIPDHSYENIIKIPGMLKCPCCGYKYGSKWTYRELPQDVIEFLNSLGVR